MAKVRFSVLDKSFDVTVTPSFLSEAECPAAVKYGRIDKRPRRSDLPLEVGRSIHGIFEKVMLLRLKGAPVDEEALTKIVKESVSVGSVPELAEIRRMVSLFLTNFNPKLETVVGVEERVGLDENGQPTDWGNATYGGILDLVQIDQTTGRVTDHKAQWNIFTKEELSKHFQTTFYLMLLRKLYPFLRRFELAIYYARHGFLAVTQRTAEELDACEQEVMIRLEAIRRWKNFDPLAGAHCSICDGRFACPKGQDFSAVPEAIVTAEQAVAAAGRIRVMEVVQKDLKKRLKKFCETNGDVKASPTWHMGFAPKKQVSYPYLEVTEKLRSYGFSVTEIATLNGAKMKKLIKELEYHNPDAYVDVMSVVTVKTATTFKGYKPGAEDSEEDDE